MQKRSDEAAWSALNASGGLEEWERQRTYSPQVDIARSSWVGIEIPPWVGIALTAYMNGTSVDDTLINWFKRTPSEDSVKLTVASIIATSEKPAHLSRAPDLPFIRFYLYKMNEPTAKMTESQFNKILTIDADQFRVRSGVDKSFGGNRTKYCSMILSIKDMLKNLGVGYTMSDQAKECRKQQQQLQELDSMKADDKYLRLGEGAFAFGADDADDDYFILNSAGAADLPPGGPLPPFVARDMKSSDQYSKSYAKLQKTKVKSQETKRLADVRASALSDLNSSSRVSFLQGDALADELNTKRLADVRASALSDLNSSSRVSFLQGDALADEFNKHMAAGSRNAMKSKKARKARKSRKARKAMNTRKSA